MLSCYCSYAVGDYSLQNRYTEIVSILCRHGIIVRDSGSSSVGNLVQVITDDISTVGCIIIFLTKSYIAAVESANFNLSQLEFNTALRRRSESILFIALEPNILSFVSANDALNLAINSRVSMDFSSDTHWNAKASNLVKLISDISFSMSKNGNTTNSSLAHPIVSDSSDSNELIQAEGQCVSASFISLGMPIQPPEQLSPSHYLPNTAVNKQNEMQNENRISLADLNSLQVARMMTFLNLDQYKHSLCVEKSVTGEHLANVTTIEQVLSLGISKLPKARLFLSKLSGFRSMGVPVQVIAETSDDPAQSDKIDIAPTLITNVSSESQSQTQGNSTSKALAFPEPTGLMTTLPEFRTIFEPMLNRAKFVPEIDQEPEGLYSTKNTLSSIAHLPPLRQCASPVLKIKNEEKKFPTGKATRPLYTDETPSAPVLSPESFPDPSSEFDVEFSASPEAGVFSPGMIVEAKPKKMKGKSNFKYHRAKIISMNSDGTFDIMMKQDLEVIRNVPRFVLCRIEDIESRQQKRHHERANNKPVKSGSIASSSTDRLVKPMDCNSVLPRLPRQFGNSANDVQMLQMWAKKQSDQLGTGMQFMSS